METMIAWRSISIEAKLISGASCVSSAPRVGHYPKVLWWTSLISLERSLSLLRIYYCPLPQLTRIVILIHVVEKSWSMCTPNSCWSTQSLLSSWHLYFERSRNLHWTSDDIPLYIARKRRVNIGNLKWSFFTSSQSSAVPHASLHEEIRIRKKQLRVKEKMELCYSSICTIPALYKSWIGQFEW